MAEHIQTLLAPDMRERGSRGVALTGHIGPLRKRDRLEISESVTDVHQNLSTFSRYPIKLNFFRECKDSMVNHPSPLLAKPNGTMRLEHFVGGFLHTLDEGLLRTWEALLQKIFSRATCTVIRLRTNL